MATAAQMAGRPTRPATGSSSAPISATAGLGQISHETISMARPMIQKAELRVRITRRTGRMIISSAPIEIMARLIETTSAMTTMMPSSSMQDWMMAVLRVCTALTALPEYR